VTEFATAALFWALAGVAVVGALAVVLSREVMRMALGLGAFLLALAGLFAYFGFGFLALAELFVYVGGVLILILFAIMLVHRTGEGRTELVLRDVTVPAVASVLLSAILFWLLHARPGDFARQPERACTGVARPVATAVRDCRGPVARRARRRRCDQWR